VQINLYSPISVTKVKERFPVFVSIHEAFLPSHGLHSLSTVLQAQNTTKELRARREKMSSNIYYEAARGSMPKVV
jgi:hypothetical protein